MEKGKEMKSEGQIEENIIIEYGREGKEREEGGEGFI